MYGGLRIKLRATLGSARIPLCIDIGFGDAVTPQAEIIEFPGLLDFPRPRIQSYSVYTVVAEKLDAMIRLGEINSRLKDFYDVWFLSQHFEFDGKILTKAFRNTFARRNTELPLKRPVALTDDFVSMKDAQWRAFAQKNNLLVLDFNKVIYGIRNFIEPPLLAAQDGSEFSLKWNHSEFWK